MKKYVLVIYFSFFCFQGFSQDSDLYKADMDLSQIYEKIKISEWDIKDSLLKSFKQGFYSTMKNNMAFDYPFDTLSSKLTKATSPDNKIKIWSWDQYTGGSWHQYISTAQIKSENGGLNVQQLNSGEEMMLGGYTDVYIYEIFQINRGNRTFYLTFGRGSHGSGNYHRLAQVFSIENNELIKCETCFEGGRELMLEVWRGDEIKLNFDPATNILSHTILVYDEMRERHYATEETQKWLFIDGVFKPIR